jgi:uncharacterized damage-inducible protein DinB
MPGVHIGVEQTLRKLCPNRKTTGGTAHAVRYHNNRRGMVMLKNDILLLYEYNYWANARVLDAVTLAGDRQFVAPGKLSHGGLRGTLLHILSAEWVWRMRCQEGVSPSALLSENEFPTIETLRDRWQTEEQAMRSFLSNLSDEELSGTVQYTTTRGMPHENVLWNLLVHVVNHGTQFRGEAGTLLAEYGHSPGDLDLIAFLREQGKGNVENVGVP